MEIPLRPRDVLVLAAPWLPPWEFQRNRHAFFICRHSYTNRDLHRAVLGRLAELDLLWCRLVLLVCHGNFCDEFYQIL